MQKLYFVRHGQSQDNSTFTWSRDDTPLTALGEEQARAAGQDMLDKGIRADVIITSPFLRAMQTARIIAGVTGYDPSKIETLDLLRERTWGSLTGQPSTAYWDEGHTYKDLDTYGGVEPIEHVQARAEQALAVLRARPEAHILVISHGTFGRAFRRVVKGEPWTDEYLDDFPTDYLKNAEVIQLI